MSSTSGNNCNQLLKCPKWLWIVPSNIQLQIIDFFFRCSFFCLNLCQNYGNSEHFMKNDKQKRRKKEILFLFWIKISFIDVWKEGNKIFEKKKKLIYLLSICGLSSFFMLYTEIHFTHKQFSFFWLKWVTVENKTHTDPAPLSSLRFGNEKWTKTECNYSTTILIFSIRSLLMIILFFHKNLSLMTMMMILSDKI